MPHGFTHPSIAGSDLPRLLSRLTESPPSPGRPDLAEQLGQWLGWTGDIALSSALSAPSAKRAFGAAAADGDALDPSADLEQTRTWLESTLAARPRDLDEDPSTFDTHRRHALARQHAMEDAIDSLRARLRAALDADSPALARLASIDEVMQQSLVPHERRLLALVPLRLQAHFERLRLEADDAEAGGAAAGTGPRRESQADPRWSLPWVRAFRDDMTCVLQAELAHRLLPCQGLVDALRHSTAAR